MKSPYFGMAALTLGSVLWIGPAARGSDTMMLGGVGSLNNSTSVTAPVMTLKGDLTTTADTVDVYFPIARGVARGAAYAGARIGYGAARVAVGTARFAAGYRPFYGYRGFGYARPWGWGYGYHRPWYGYYRPYYAWYRPYYPGVYLNYSVGGYSYYPAYYSASPATYYSPAVTCYSPVAVDYSGYAAPPQVVETGPMPVPNSGYRYDGGPAQPVPPPAVAPKPVTPPPPAVDPVVRRPTKKIEYPAYGEVPSKVRVAGPDPLLVKDTRGQ